MNAKTEKRSLTGMHQLIKATHIDFLGKSKPVLVGSGVVLMICLLSLAVRWLNLGLDFTGGTLIEVGYPAPVDIPQVREVLAEEGFGGAQTQHFGTSSEVLIRIAPQQDLNSAAVSSRVLAALQAQDAAVEMRRVEFVGPKVGDELIEDGGLAMLYALICILIYVTLRFEWRLALGTIRA
jgi:preprotein translocase subunit SecF